MNVNDAAILREVGFLLFEPTTYKRDVKDLFSDQYRSLLKQEINNLEPEEPHKASGRFRRHAKAILFPDINELRFLIGLSGTGYYQGAYNPEKVLENRSFRSLSDDLLMHPATRDLVMLNYGKTKWNGYDLSLPLCVGLSIINFFISETENRKIKVGATPNTYHQDGEVYTFAHLLETNNTQGGENLISKPENAGKKVGEVHEDEVLVKFKLQNFFQSYGIYDPAVSHHVNTISQLDTSKVASRTILLIDFTPMKLIHH